MKKLIYLMVLLLFNCEDVIDVELPASEERLVIDAAFDVLSENNNETIARVVLSLTTGFFNESIPAVTNANVEVINLDANESFIFSNPNGDGVFTNEAFQIDTNSRYQLNINYNNELYSAIEQLVVSVPIDNLTQGDGELFNENDTEVIIEFTDDGSRDDFYLFDFDFNNFIVSKDEFYQGNTFEFSYFYEDLAVGDDINVRLIGIDEQHYNYMNLLIVQSGQDTGGPFQSPSASVRGNIINTTNSNNYPLGYFRISEVYEAPFTIQ